SLLRHIKYTKEYMKNVWGVDNLEVDFSPDTFGHSAYVPEINQFGEVKYYYHCRGNARGDVLYRYRAPSGKEILTYREPNWYNGAVTPHMGAGLPEISKRCQGLRTGLVVYGVGDHGGGPTRRDVERAIEMMTWKIYPKIKFGTIREFFKEAEVVWDKLPVVDQELNYFAPGCYTTQSRIKRGNRRLEASLLDAEAMISMAGNMVGFSYAKEKMEKAWRDVLFTHFHDILTGSCVQDSREHAMGLFQTSSATANTQIQNAMRAIGQKIDTSSILVDIDAYNSQSEGAGAGYGIENFIGVPSTERGSGRTRIFHVFNALPRERKQVIELTVWDWTGDLRRLAMRDYQGNEIPFQLLDHTLQQYWDHKYVRVLADVTVPALGYTTIVLFQKEPDTYLTYLQEREHVAGVFDDYFLENELITVRISSESGRILSVWDKATGQEMIDPQNSAGFTYIETETITSSAWNIGRYLKSVPVDRCIQIEEGTKGSLRHSVKAVYQIASSKIEVVYSLDKYQSAVKMDITADWHESGSEIIPVLDYRVPLAYKTDRFMYDVPAGVITREARHNDVPGLQYGMALGEKESGTILISDSKYGYRGADNTLGITLINSSTSPDPYPERGIHHLTLWLGSCAQDAKKAEEMATICNRNLFYQPSNSHTGILPMEQSLFSMEAKHAVISAVVPSNDHDLCIRAYETAGERENIRLIFKNNIKSARLVNLFEKEQEGEVNVKGKQVEFEVKPFAIAEIKISLE
ncbi:MAG: glycoside hydrolase family 38 C-terminal domain-containing protein, partial [Lachnospiraceae bacterium]|nr:glycoside hydrolase family 38 C-terminal domain-containing protein [Lachnospiraceae bacterium]